MAIRPGYTRVSEILAIRNSFSHIDINILDRKARIGTEVHNAIACYWEDVHIPLQGREQKYFESFLIWQSTMEVSPIIWEKRFYCDDLMITGAIDALIPFQGEDLPLIVDFKTSASPSTNWPLQAMFYHYLTRKSGYQISDRVFFLMLNEVSRAPKLYEYAASGKLWDECLKLLMEYRNLMDDGKEPA